MAEFLGLETEDFGETFLEMLGCDVASGDLREFFDAGLGHGRFDGGEFGFLYCEIEGLLVEKIPMFGVC